MQTARRTIEYVPLDKIREADANPKRHDTGALDESLDGLGLIEPVIIDERTGQLLSGHGRTRRLLARQMRGESPPAGIEVGDGGEWLVPVVRGLSSDDDDDARAALLAVNRIVESGGWDTAELAEMLGGLDESRGLTGTGYDGGDLDALLAALDSPTPSRSGEPRQPSGPSLSDRFLVPPFSVLDARQGYWQDRKRAWLSIGIRSELGRGEDRHIGLHFPATTLGANGRTQESADPIGRSRKADARSFGQDLMRGEHVVGSMRRDADRRSNVTGAAKLPGYANNGTEYISPGTSIFDPVLCEIAYRWFCPPGGRVLDPFAGGSVRGVVAARLGRPYLGVDLRSEQVDANRDQADLCDSPVPAWIVGDSRDLAMLVPPDDRFDLVFTCPPYYDLEVYSDDDADLSRAATYSEFLDGYRTVIAAAADRLSDDRFAVVVVSEIRDGTGRCAGLVPDTIAAAAAAGLDLYNEAVLLNAIGSLPLRAGRSFVASRKLGRTHQNVLVFIKGDPKAAVAACGPVDMADAADLLAGVDRDGAEVLIPR